MASAPQDITRSLQAFAAGFHEQGKQLSELQVSSPATFQQVILSLLLEARDTPKFRFLIAYLSSRGFLPQTLEGLRRVDRGLAALVVELAERMLPDGLPAPAAPPPAVVGPEAGYLVGLLEAFSTGLNLLSINGPIEDLDTRVRARLALILGKAARTHDAFLALTADTDARVRANCVEALWGSQSATAREVFARAAGDAHHRVAANALIGQYLQGDPASVAGLAAMIRRSDTASKGAAAWAMGRTGDSRFAPLLQATRRLPGQDPLVVRNCLAAIKRIQHNSAAELGQEVLLRILDARRTPDGNIVLSVSARVAGAVEAPRFAGTAFSIVAGETPVWNYDCREAGAPPALAVAFLLPIGLEGMRAKGRIYRALLQQAFGRRREDDRIALALYAGTPVVSPNPLFGPGPLASDPAGIDATLSDPPGPANVAQGPLAPLAEVASSLRSFAGERHMVWLVEALDLSLLERAGTPNLEGVTLHAICTGQASEAACRFASALARSSGGAYVRLESEEDLGAACEDLEASLYHHYRLVCAAPKEAVRWSVQLSNGRFQGSASR